MTIQLNHTIVWCRDQRISAAFLTEMFGLPAPTRFGPFLVIELANGASLDYYETDKPIASQHYAFLVDEEDFDRILANIRRRELPHWADPGKNRAGAINHNDGGRGVYFEDPDGHLLEAITRPYGVGSAGL